MKKVAVIMGSDSDWPVVKAACTQLKEFGIPFEAHILSAHRTPVEAAAYASSAKENEIGVIICAAGMVGLVAARAMAGVHWATDILGGILLGAALVAVYHTIAFADYGKASRGKHARR